MSVGPLKADVKKREAIKEAFVLSWGAYGKFPVRPHSRLQGTDNEDVLVV